jgi:hypothetical protein
MVKNGEVFSNKNLSFLLFYFSFFFNNIKMKAHTIIILTFIILLSLILCIYLENNSNYLSTKENFDCLIQKNININKCNDNDLNIKMINNKTKVNNINPLVTPSFDNIITKIRTNLGLDAQDLQFNSNLQKQKDSLNDIDAQVKNISANRFVNNYDEKVNEYRSVSSFGDSQTLNLRPLSNHKYMISLNGKDKCLESNSLNKNSVQPCNLQNPNQYFTLEFINNDVMYKNKTLGEIYNQDYIANNTDVQYPFTLLKSSSDNCIGITDKSLTIGPCTYNINQRWNPSNKPVLCKK